MSFLTFGLSGFLMSSGLIFVRGGGPSVVLFGGLTFGGFSGLFGGLVSGGMFALKQFVLRLFLWKSGSPPLRYVAFLAQAKNLLFLRQVGGYIFVHRLLREYFVSLAGSKKTTNTSSAT
jgi:hypothetical protein